MTSVVYTLIWRMDSPRVKIENKGSRDQKLGPYRTSQRKSRIDPAQSSVPDDTKGCHERDVQQESEACTGL